jgi:hypothetical protein
MGDRTLVSPQSSCWNASCSAYGQLDQGNIRKFGRTPGVSSAINVVSAVARLLRRLVPSSMDAGGHRKPLSNAWPYSPSATAWLPSRPFQTGGNTMLNRSTRFRSNPHVVLVPLLSLLGTAPWLAASVRRGAVCLLPTPLLSTNSASGSTEAAR